MEPDSILYSTYSSINNRACDKINDIWVKSWTRGSCTDEVRLESVREIIIAMAQALCEEDDD
jgi:hypothetical protein